MNDLEALQYRTKRAINKIEEWLDVIEEIFPDDQKLPTDEVQVAVNNLKIYLKEYL